jgi:hypothetical protein
LRPLSDPSEDGSEREGRRPGIGRTEREVQVFKRLLSAELKLWHLLLVVVLLVIGSGTSFGQTGPPTDADSSHSSLSSNAFFPSGSFHMAAASSNISQYVHAVDGEVEVLRVSFSVPSGKKADIAAFFNAEAYKYPNGYCYLTFYLDGIATTALQPGELWVADGYVYNGAYPTISAQGYKANVGAGKHSVIVTLRATGGDCYVNDRSVVLISNQHT